MAEVFLGVSGLLIASSFITYQWAKFGLPFVLLSALCFVSLSPVFLLFVALYIYVTWQLTTSQQKEGNPWITRLFQLLWLLLSAGLITHKLPGYQGLLVAGSIALKANSLPTSIYLNVDKALFSWSALCFIPLIKRSFPSNCHAHSWLAAFCVPIGIAAVVVIAVNTGIVTWQIAVPAWFPLLALSNLINTCVAEELLFRGLLCKLVMNKLPVTLSATARNVLILMISSAIFGLAHFAGGTSYMVVATVAGVLYGAVYMVTGRIIFAVLTHWLLNISHMLVLTYPMTNT